MKHTFLEWGGRGGGGGGGEGGEGGRGGGGGGGRLGAHIRSLTNNCPEIESGGFWQLADCSQLPNTCVQNRCHFLYKYDIIFQNSGEELLLS